jgi:glycosyltransferase involved in cell wall biosynthesis
VILFLHNVYRTTGGEEHVVDDLLWLVREGMGEDAELVTRDSAQLGRPRAAIGMLRGGLAPEDVTAAVRRTGARVVHAHNLNPAFGWRALAAAREAGARVVLHLHNYRLVCAVGTCFTRGEDCTRCHRRNTFPGIRLNCRGTGAEAVVYGAGLAAWQRRLAAQVDVFVVPSAFAAQRLGQLGAPLGERVRVVPHVVRQFAQRSSAGAGSHVLVASRLAPEKGVDVAIDACRTASLPLVVAGAGPEERALRRRAEAADVRFVGAVDRAALDELRAGAALALVPSRSAETFGLAAAEAMATGVPVAAARSGALAELVPEDALATPGDAGALAGIARRLYADERTGESVLAAIREQCAPERVAPLLAEVYG